MYHHHSLIGRRLLGSCHRSVVAHPLSSPSPSPLSLHSLPSSASFSLSPSSSLIRSHRPYPSSFLSPVSLCHLRLFSSSSSSNSPPLPSYSPRVYSTRNIGIIAHIDAGKTTTSERILYYANKIGVMGEVDHGDTRMDFLPEERERGITIKAACISFQWSNKEGGDHRINLIDTPGHVDFTVEVECAMRVMDGAICILDGVKGVQPQTETVWRQAQRYRIPRLVFVNKMDRVGANLFQSVKTIQNRLKGFEQPYSKNSPLNNSATTNHSSEERGGGSCIPVLLQLPIFINNTNEEWATEGEMGGSFEGLIDLIGGLQYRWSSSSDDDGSVPLITPLSDDHPLASSILSARNSLIEQLSEHDDNLMEKFLSDVPDTLSASFKYFPQQTLRPIIRRLTIQRIITPVFCGASFKNKGVQPLMDAITYYLPSPVDYPYIDGLSFKEDEDGYGKRHQKRRSPSSSSSSDNALVRRVVDDASNAPLVALAFKVVHDHQRAQPIVFVRVYSGSLSDKDTLTNTTALERQRKEMLLEQSQGQTNTKDKDKEKDKDKVWARERVSRLLEVEADSHRDIKVIEMGNIGAIVGLKNTRSGDTLVRSSETRSHLILPSIHLPEPVFFSSVEAESISEQKHLDASLACMVQEDPSIQISQDKETGQTLIKGMGELHMEIISNRLKSDWKCDAIIGKMRVAYRETPTVEIIHTEKFTGMASNSLTASSTLNEAEVTLRITPREQGSGNDIQFSSSIVPQSTTGFTLAMADAIESAINDGLMRGPVLAYPVTDTLVTIESVNCFATSTPSAFRAAASKCLQECLSASNADLLEPLMLVEISVPNNHVGNVLADITGRRRGVIRSVNGDDGDHLSSDRSDVKAEVPLSELMGYSTHLRSQTAGTGTLSMQYHAYHPVGPFLQAKFKQSPP